MKWLSANLFLSLLVVGVVSSIARGLPNQRDLRRVGRAWDYNGQYVVLNAGVTGAKVWSALDGKFLYNFKRSDRPLLDVRLSRCTPTLITCHLVPQGLGYDSPVLDPMRVWDLRTGKQLFALPEASYGQFSHDGSTIFGLQYPPGSYPRRRKPITKAPVLCAWDAKSGKRKFSVPLKGKTPPYSGYTLQESGDGTTLLLAYSDNWWVIEIASGRVIQHITLMRGGGDDLQYINHSATLLRQAGPVGITTSSLPAGQVTQLELFPQIESSWQTGWFHDGNAFAAVDNEGTLFSKGDRRVVKKGGNIGRPLSVLADNTNNFLIVHNLLPTVNKQLATAYDILTCEPVWQTSSWIFALWNNRAVAVDADRDPQQVRITLLHLKDGYPIRTIVLENR
ncbi:MAG: hypothetical protein SFX74_01660 [Fimbriimonadaceae bacterium]|nr:hypothetical protein [Fimbriimonadaceae bacterium]